ncbi:MAG: TonB-dependent receptor [Gammaproteobacteria bacterium]|nr:TonB-dependent receptor [Gammaproteobacteria bacterium]
MSKDSIRRRLRSRRYARQPLYFAISAVLGTASAAVAAQDQADEIFVTGSRIQQTGMQTPTPVTAVQADELQAMAPGNMVEGLSQLPQFFGNQSVANTAPSWFTRGGYGNLDLRGLGINRTLTLLNGRRVISSTAFGGVDVNVIPESMIRSVESVTGGASAAYGTDAVAGVVNFILDTDFTGFDAHVQGGTTSRGDADNYEVSVAFGADIGERAHVLVAAEYYDQDGVIGYDDRDWYQAWGTVPDANGMLLIRPQVVSRNSSFDGVIFAPGSALNGYQFQSDGSVTPFVSSDTFSGTIGTPPARQSIVNGGSGTDLGQNATLYPDNARDSIFAYLDYDLTDDLTVFGQYIRGSNRTFRKGPPLASFQGTPTAITIFQDNAFLPDAVRQTMVNENLASFTLRRTGSDADLAADMGQRDSSTMNSGTVGFSWDIDNGGMLDGWSVDGYYQYGENSRTWDQTGLRVDRIHAAVDAVVDPNTGATVCRTSLFQATWMDDRFAGCVPLNLFGRGNASAGAVDWVIGNEPGQSISTPLFFADTGFDLGETETYTSVEAKRNITTMKQHLFELSANGEIWEGFGAGAVSLAVGGSYREEKIRQVVHDSTNLSSDHTSGHPVLCNGDPEAVAAGLRGVSGPDCANTVGIQYSKVSNIQGKISVTELFAETLVPLIAEQDFMKLMTLNLSARWADYTGSGSIWAYKGGLDAQMTDDFRLRGTYSRDVRAANLSERYDKTGGVATITDARYPGDGPYNVTRFSGGNPAVRPEKADTFTVGFVYQPSFVEGLSMSLDWYKVKIKGAIGQLGTQAVADQCEAGAADLCSLVTRDSVTDRLILVGDVFVNVDKYIVSGIDLELAFRRDITLFGGNEEFLQARLFASWLDENSQQLSGAAKIDRAGQTGLQQSDGVAYALPEYKLTGNISYSYGPFTTFLQGRYIDSGTMQNSLVEGVNIESNHVASAFYMDLRLSYSYDLPRGGTVELYGTVTNLLDEDPPVTPYYGVFGGFATQTNSALFDMLGRRYVAGVHVKY